MISSSAQRIIYRSVHLILAVPVIGYVYSPFEQLPNYAPVVRYIAIPAIFITGLLMWKGHLLRRLFAGKPAHPTVAG